MQSRAKTPPDVVNLTYWFTAETIKQLTRITSSVQKLSPSNFKSLCEVTISACARKASLADPRISVPVRLRPDRYPVTHILHSKSVEILKYQQSLDVVQLFFCTLEQYASKVSSLWPIRHETGQVIRYYENSLGLSNKSLASHPSGTADLVITSPPYLGAQKYIRAASLTLGWLSLAPSNKLRHLEDMSIGREHFYKRDYTDPSKCGILIIDKLLRHVYKINPLRAHIASKYIVEMREVLSTCYRIIKPGGKMVLVSGSNTLCGQVFDTTSYLKQICMELGFSVSLELTDVIKSRGLMTRRNKTAGLIPMESVTLFEK
jgi:hypothetical protein